MSAFIVQTEDEKLFNNFISKVDIKDDNSCWTWKGSLNSAHKRPMFWFKEKWTTASRACMYFKQGFLTEGLQVCHDPVICNNSSCVNPFHLREDTPSANTKDLLITGNHNNKRKTHCPKNHEYSEDNTYYYNGKRYCKECKRDYKRKKDK